MLNNPLPDLRAGQIWRRRDGTNTTLRENATRDGFTCSRDNIFIPALSATPEGYYLYGKHTPSIHDLLVLTSAPNEEMPAYVPHTHGPEEPQSVVSFIPKDGEAPYHWPYVTKDSGKREEFATGSVRDTTDGKGSFVSISPHMLKRLADLMERGAKKYGLFNYQKGQPLSRIADSLMRHTNQARMGDTSEDHKAAIVFNAMAWIHFEEEIAAGRLPSELNDLPKYVP